MIQIGYNTIYLVNKDENNIMWRGVYKIEMKNIC